MCGLIILSVRGKTPRYSSALTQQKLQMISASHQVPLPLVGINSHGRGSWRRPPLRARRPEEPEAAVAPKTEETRNRQPSIHLPTRAHLPKSLPCRPEPNRQDELFQENLGPLGRGGGEQPKQHPARRWCEFRRLNLQIEYSQTLSPIKFKKTHGGCAQSAPQKIAHTTYSKIASFSRI